VRRIQDLWVCLAFALCFVSVLLAGCGPPRPYAILVKWEEEIQEVGVGTHMVSATASNEHAGVLVGIVQAIDRSAGGRTVARVVLVPRQRLRVREGSSAGMVRGTTGEWLLTLHPPAKKARPIRRNSVIRGVAPTRKEAGSGKSSVLPDLPSGLFTAQNLTLWGLKLGIMLVLCIVAKALVRMALAIICVAAGGLGAWFLHTSFELWIIEIFPKRAELGIPDGAIGWIGAFLACYVIVLVLLLIPMRLAARK